MGKVRIVVADDHRLFRDGLRLLLSREPDLEVAGEAEDGDSAIAMAERLRPDVVLLDMGMPRVGGRAALEEIGRRALGLHVIVLTAYIEQHEVLDVLRLGARGIVMKGDDTAVLVRAVRAVTGGELWVGREIVTAFVRELTTGAARDPAPTPYGVPTRREREVVERVLAGCTNRDIAREISITENTVKRHLTHVFDKLGVSNRLELALRAASEVGRPPG